MKTITPRLDSKMKSSVLVLGMLANWLWRSLASQNCNGRNLLLTLFESLPKRMNTSIGASAGCS